MIILKPGSTAIGEYEFSENGNEQFTQMLDNLDLNGHTEPEYRAAKVVFLTWMFKGRNTGYITKDEIANVLICSKILTDGPASVLSGGIEAINVETAFEKLGIMHEQSFEDLVLELDRLKDKFNDIRSIIIEMSDIELFYPETVGE